MRMRRLAVFFAAVAVLLIALPARASNDSFFGDLWNITKVNAPGAWGVSTGGVRVGIVDSGVDAGHPDLNGHVVDSVACIGTSGSASQCSGSGDDVIGHGTHVAGIIAATKDNNEGVAGVAPSAQLVVARVFDGSGSANFNDINAGAQWVVQHGAKVVNFSLGDAGVLGTGLLSNNNAMKDITSAIWNAGGVAVVSAGNSGDGCANWSGTTAVVVAGTGPNDELGWYSCALSGAQWGIAAPGGDANDCTSEAAKCVLSTYARSKTPSGKAPYAYLQGTSMAAPVVTGALADLLAKGLSRQDAIDRLLATVDGASCGSGCRGRVNVARAVCGDSCPAVPSGGGGGGGGGLQPITPTTLGRTSRPSSSTAATRKPAAATAPAVTTTLAPTTTTELAATTIPPPEANTLAAPAFPKSAASSNGHDAGDLPIALAAVGLAAAVSAVSTTAWRQRKVRAGGAL
jgi:subtilisin family serine protease